MTGSTSRFSVSRRFRALIATAAVLASVAVVQAVSAEAAHARCDGEDVHITSTVNSNGIPVAEETPIRPTCDGNGFYAFQFRSFAPGWRASVWRQDNSGGWHGYFGGYDLNLHSDHYTDSNSWANMHLCLDHISGSNWYCGVRDQTVQGTGPRHDYVLPNRGF